jgi:hypothetical protein
MVPETQYAMTPDGVLSRTQVTGQVQWTWPGSRITSITSISFGRPILGPLLRGIASFARLIIHDRRGTGLSSSNVAPPNLETRVADPRVALDDEIDASRESNHAWRGLNTVLATVLFTDIVDSTRASVGSGRPRLERCNPAAP